MVVRINPRLDFCFPRHHFYFLRTVSRVGIGVDEAALEDLVSEHLEELDVDVLERKPVVPQILDVADLAPCNVVHHQDPLEQYRCDITTSPLQQHYLSTVLVCSQCTLGTCT
jgi:hypothetical protein